MEFKDWLNDKFLEWERTMPRRQSYSAFSRYLGVKQTTFSQWITGNGLPSPENATLLSEKLGPEIYDILGLRRPDADDPRAALIAAGIPEDFTDRVLAARSEYTEELAKKGMAKDSPEAREIVRDAFARHGIQLTDTE